jgi:hypothetical protein
LPLTVTEIWTLSFGPTPVNVTVALEPGPVKFSCTVPSGTLVNVNCPWLSAVVEMPVPTTLTVTLRVSSMLNEPDSTARGAVMALPLMIPEIDAPADEEDGATGDREALPPQAVATMAVSTKAKTVMMDRMTFMNFLQSGKLRPATAINIPSRPLRLS